MRLRLLAACLLLGLVSAVHATGCPQHYVGGKPPAIVKASLKQRTQELCFQAFGVMHSGVSRTPLWSAEHLVRGNVEQAQALVRKNTFHAEKALPAADRASLSDYARSGWERGHMSPNDDMPTAGAQAEAFSLANMVPQQHATNAGVWFGIETATRRMAVEDGEVYVVSGPAFIGDRIDSLQGRVLVPTHLWKVIYRPVRNQAGAYLITNDETKDYSAVTVTELEQFVGLSLLPGVAKRVRDAGMELPVPTKKASAARRRGEPAPEVEYNLSGRARQAIETLLKKFR